MDNPLAAVNRIALSYYRVPLGSKLILAIFALFFVLGFSSGFRTWALLDPTLVFAGGGKRSSSYMARTNRLSASLVDLSLYAPWLLPSAYQCRGYNPPVGQV